MALTAAGKLKIAAHGSLLIVDVLVLAFATRVNRFQEFFFMADLFPFVLSIVTLVILTTTLSLDLAMQNSYIGRAQFEIGMFGLLSICWLAFNAFSTARWRLVPFHCNASVVPNDTFPGELAWCKDVQALKGLVWIEFVMCFVTWAMTSRYAFTQYNRGYKHIFKMPLSRYRPEFQAPSAKYARDSEFLQYDKAM